MQFPIRVLTGAAALIAVSTLGPAIAQATPPDFVQFRTPSGNIGCTVSATTAACEISQHDYATPPRPENCHLQYGDRLVLENTGVVDFHCHGDRLVESTAAVLDYGTNVTVGGLTCLSTTDYVECAGAGHSFRLSRQAYTID
ncbi:DUF6636 domain-containing protein [Nocardia sp. NPDC046763]|uniref:DUF6636 domain-containing protein n=1 Tax=Nocardia sp. NPDC046763 TaxID=3155256 RepID=UPI0033C9C89A